MAADGGRPGSALAPLGLALAVMAGAALVVSMDPAAASRGEDAPRLLIDKEAAYAREAAGLAAAGLRIVEDYGAFVLAEPPEGMGAAQLRARGLAVRREIARGVKLRRGRLTGAWSARGRPASGGEEGLHLVALGGPARPAWVERIRDAARGRILMALPESAYLAWLTPEGRDDLAAAGGLIDFVMPLPASDRLSPELDGGPDPAAVTVLFIGSPEGRAAAGAAEDRAIASIAPAPRLAGLEARVLILSRAGIEEIGTWEEVVWVEPYRAPATRDELSAVITAGLSAGGRPLGPQYRQWLGFHGLSDLSSYVVQVMDTGIDSGGTGREHPALAGRLAFALDETLEGSQDDCVGHGTNIAGIIAGDPPPGSALRDGQGYELGLGVAPGARVGASRIFTCDGNFRTTRPYGEILSAAYDHGARFSNNSWGTGGSSYSSLAREFDAIVRDVNQDPSDGDQQMTVVFAAGNKGPNSSTIDVPGVAKNVITVGATESYRPEATDGCGLGPESADDAEDVRLGSSRGPTVDGRTKPDLVAPGSHIISAASQAAGYTGLGVCDTYFPPGQRLYNWTSGTSQATAHVTGGAVVAAESFRRRFGAAPSPAMIKASLVATAHDLGRPGDDFSSPEPHRPSNAQGWGRVDLTSLVEDRDVVAFDQTDLLRASGEQIVKGPFLVADPARPVAVVLAWTDAPGTPAGSSWVNDLDLSVRAGGDTYLGNAISNGFSVTGGQADGKNNVESVFLAAGATASLSVTVTATSLPGDGVPSAPGLTDQDFALYLNNVIQASSSGTIEFLGDGFDCSGTATLRVVDRGLAGGGRVRVLVSSTSEATPEPFDLPELAGRSGMFQGQVHLGTGAADADGVVQAADGDILVGRYDDADDGTGAPATVTASAPVTCSPLTIANPRVESIGDDKAVVRWGTNRPASSVVTGSRGIDVRSPALVTDHRVVIEDLVACSPRQITITSTDASGTTAVHPASGSMQFSTGSGRVIDLFFDDLESFRGRWRHSGAGDSWEIGLPSSGPQSAHSGLRLWGTHLDGPYDTAADMALTTPPFELRHLDAPALSFWQFVQIPLSAAPGGAQDGAWVEISTDGGVSWNVIAPESGYPVPQGPNNPYLPNGSGVFAGSGAGWHQVRFDLSPFGGGTAVIRFRLWRDPQAAAPGAGWYIDDIRVSAGLPCHEGALVLDAGAYGCSAPLRVTVADTDLDSSPLARDHASVTVTGPSGSTAVTLLETGVRSAMFTGALPLAPPGGTGFEVSEGDALEVEYFDASAGSGLPVTLRAFADVPDCTPPSPPTSLSVEPAGSGRLLLRWNDPPDQDLAEVRIHYDSDGPGPVYSGEGAVEGASPVAEEIGRRAAALTGLPACVPHFISMTSVDDFGNESLFSAEAAAAPVGSAPCPHARLTLARGDAGCTESVLVQVEDANADGDPSSPGAIAVTARSATDPSALPMTLTETGPASGVFTGMLNLAEAPAPGALAVSEGDEVGITYLDLDPGFGSPAPVVATLAISDCTPPVISGLRAAAPRTGSISVSWETDEPAATIVAYGSTPALGFSINDPVPRTSHGVVLPGSPSCGTVHYRVVATDLRGNVAVADDAGVPLHSGLGRMLGLVDQDFEAGAPGWTHGGAKDEWELGVPLAGPPPSPSGSVVWGLDLDGRYEPDADVTLTSPPIDLTGAGAATLTFLHWFDIWSFNPTGGPGRDDGAWVEVSDDGGKTWTYVTPAGGYPNTVGANPYIPDGSPAYAGTSSGWTQASLLLDPFVGRSVRIRFHLYVDPFPDSGYVPGYGWYIDDVQVEVETACHQGFLRVTPSAADCGDSPIRVALWDVDLDADPSAPDSALVEATSPSDPSPLVITMTETGASTGTFEGSIPIGAAAGAGTLRVASGDEVRTRYDDADDGTGAPALAESTASIGDCAAPVISSVRATRITAGSALIEWETDEPATSEVVVLPAGSKIASAALTRKHALTASGIPACGAFLFEVASVDAGGNRAEDDNSGSAYHLDGAREFELYHEGFEGSAPGWRHSGNPDEWEFGAPVAGPPGPFAGSSVAGTDLDGDYDKPRESSSHEMILESPTVSLEGLLSARLAFRHFYRFASPAGGDGGFVEVHDGTRWRRIAPSGGYSGSIRTDLEGGSRPAFIAASGVWREASFDLGEFVGRHVRVRFVMHLDHGTRSREAGWFVDEVRFLGSAECRKGVLTLDASSYSCGPVEARVTLADADLDQSASSAETVVLQASGATWNAPLSLTETGLSTGVFVGSLHLAPAPGLGGEVVNEGDRVGVDYDDADDGSGAGAALRAEAGIDDCAPPAISAVRVRPASTGTGLQVEWGTSEPATGAAVLTVASGVRAASSLDMTTSHKAIFSDLAECEAYSLEISAVDASGNESTASGTAPPMRGELSRRQILFFDNMEGIDPGWTHGGVFDEWERGQPLVGPPGAFSGTRVFGTDLDGQYQGASDATLISPSIDLRAESSARLALWHYFDVFADGTPNADDDGAWVEVASQGVGLRYIFPISGYNNTIDRDANPPITPGSGVYAGKSVAYVRSEFDLTQFAGQIINLRFRLWNDGPEGIFNLATGAGWYLDDVEVSAPRSCFARPALQRVDPSGALLQGAAGVPVTISGSGFRTPVALEAGEGVVFRSVQVASAQSVTALVDIAGDAAAVPRDLTLTNPDGQQAVLGGAVPVAVDPARADIDGSGGVDGRDFAVLARAFGSFAGESRYSAEADLNADGVVDGKDLAVFGAHFGEILPP